MKCSLPSLTGHRTVFIHTIDHKLEMGFRYLGEEMHQKGSSFRGGYCVFFEGEGTRALLPLIYLVLIFSMKLYMSKLICSLKCGKSYFICSCKHQTWLWPPFSCNICRWTILPSPNYIVIRTGMEVEMFIQTLFSHPVCYKWCKHRIFWMNHIQCK